jgi:uncharacterized protein YbaP (TraB family)
MAAVLTAGTFAAETAVKTEKKRAPKAATKEAKKSFCWKVSSKTSTLYLLGSVHMGTPDMVPLAKNVEDAFDSSQYVFVEVDPEKADKATVMQKLMYTPPDTLKNNISEKTYNEIVDFFKNYGTPEQAIAQMKPGAIAMMISVLKLTELGFNPQFGIDLYFLQKAKGKKKVRELETIDQQLSLIESMGEQFLKYTLEEVDKSEEELARLIKAWKTGNADDMDNQLQESMKKNPDLKPFYDKFIYDRNKKMALKLEQSLRRKGTYFGIIGAAHLVGKDGIIDILKKSGKYKIKQL